MAYDPTIPAAANTVRGASGDLVKMKTNFAHLDPVATSGIHGLVSGGSAVSGAVVVTQAAGAASQFHYRTLTVGNLNDTSIAGAASGSILILSGSTWVDRLLKVVNLLDVVGGGAATSGQVLVSDGAGNWSPAAQSGGGGGGGGGGGDVIVPQKRATLSLPSGVNFSTTQNTDHLLTGLEIREASGSVAYNAASGIIEVPSGVTHVRLFGQVRWASNASADRRLWYLFGSDARPLGNNEPKIAAFSIVQAVNGTNTLQQIKSPWLEVTPGTQIKFYARQGGSATLNIEPGYAVGGTGQVHQSYWTAEFGSASGFPAGPAVGVYSMTSGGTYTLNNNQQSIISGLTQEVQAATGLSLNSGTLTISAAEGYTHYRVCGTITFSGTATPTGQREILFYQDGGGVHYSSGTPIGYFSYRTEANRSTSAYTNLTLNTPLLALSGSDTTVSLAGSQINGGTLNVLGGGGAGWGGLLTTLTVECYKYS